mgnify:CR=1 FL=1
MDDDAGADLSVADQVFSFAGAYEGSARWVWAGIKIGESMASDRWSADEAASSKAFVM